MAALIPSRFRATTMLAAVLALVAAGCANPFEPAKPDPPDPSAVVEDYSTPVKLLGTLVEAMQNKGPAGRLAWINAMADSAGPGTRAFYAFHDPLVVSAWGQTSGVPAPNPWDLELEQRFYDRFVGLLPRAYVMVFDRDNTSPSEIIDDVAGHALLHRRYVVQADDPQQPILVAIGYVDLYLAKYDGRWWITRWQDRVDPLVGVDPTNLEDEATLGYRRLQSVSS